MKSNTEHRTPNTAKISDFYWHQVTEKEKEKIKQDSKKLLTEFASKLSKIKTKDYHFKNNSGTRQEGSGWETDQEFKNTTLSNTPFVENNFIITQRGAWKK